MKRYRMKVARGLGQMFMRGKIVDILRVDDRHWVTTLRYKTKPDKKVLTYID